MCKYYIVTSDTLVGSLGYAVFVARCNTIRTSWGTKKKRLSYRRNCIEEFVWGISLFWLHALLSMSFCCFLRLLPHTSQVTHLWNDCCKDIYLLLCVAFCVVMSWETVEKMKIYHLILYAFFISNAFFQLTLSVARLFHELSFKCCLGVVWYI